MKSKVYFADLRAKEERNVPDRIASLLERAGLPEVIGRGGLVAVKMHFGEAGNTAFIRPVLVRRVISEIKRLGGSPFLTDTGTLYRGSRENAVKHIETATANGFAYSVVGAPLIIADGIRGIDSKRVEIDGVHHKRVPVARAIAEADALVVLSHFKCHELTGFGGALKNMGMGCTSREGKLDQHSTVSPHIDRDLCTGCESCIRKCGYGAIALVEGKSMIDPEKCVGCGECIVVCPEEAIRINWDGKTAVVQEKMVEYAAGAVSGKQGRCLFANFITDVSPACDCYGHSDAPIVAGIGYAASTDPVAVDRACADLVNQAQGLSGTALRKAHKPGADKFRDVYPDIDWTIQFVHAQAVGLGNPSYELIRLPLE